jgi:hypothetical protein
VFCYTRTQITGTLREEARIFTFLTELVINVLVVALGSNRQQYVVIDKNRY